MLLLNNELWGIRDQVVTVLNCQSLAILPLLVRLLLERSNFMLERFPVSLRKVGDSTKVPVWSLQEQEWALRINIHLNQLDIPK